MDDQKQSRTLSKETSSEPSFRVLYYGESGAAVPFKWESQPGTPKHALYSDYAALPPLTPPPSYLARLCRREPDPKSKSHHRRRLKMVVLLTALVRRGSHVSPTSSYSSSSSSCETTSFYSKGRKTTRPPPLMVALMDEDDLRAERMRMCFGGRFGSLKNALFSVVGCRRRSSSSSSHSVGYFV